MSAVLCVCACMCKNVCAYCMSRCGCLHVCVCVCWKMCHILDMYWQLKRHIKTAKNKEDIGEGGVGRNVVCVCVFCPFNFFHNEYMCLRAAWTWAYWGLAVSAE